MNLFLIPIILAVLRPPHPVDVARARAILQIAPHVTPAAALAHAASARAHATAPVTPELLLATASIESNFRRRAVSRWVYRGETRRAVTGVWSAPATGERVVFRYCGFLQTKPPLPTLRSCIDLGDDIDLSYQLAAAELQRWLAYCRRKGKPPGRSRLLCAVAGYRSGWRAADAGGGPRTRFRLELADRIRAQTGRFLPVSVLVKTRK